MAKSKQSHETAQALVNPLFAWTNAVLKGGEMMLDSMRHRGEERTGRARRRASRRGCPGAQALGARQGEGPHSRAKGRRRRRG